MYSCTRLSADFPQQACSHSPNCASRIVLTQSEGFPLASPHKESGEEKPLRRTLYLHFRVGVPLYVLPDPFASRFPRAVFLVLLHRQIIMRPPVFISFGRDGRFSNGAFSLPTLELSFERGRERAGTGIADATNTNLARILLRVSSSWDERRSLEANLLRKVSF